jgi:hypothetical protein
MRFAAYSTPDRLPPRLGSNARRRGREAVRQRCAVTTAMASAAMARTPNWILFTASATAASGHTSSRLRSSGRNSITATCRTKSPTKNVWRITTSMLDVSRPPVAKLRISAA